MYMIITLYEGGLRSCLCGQCTSIHSLSACEQSVQLVWASLEYILYSLP